MFDGLAQKGVKNATMAQRFTWVILDKVVICITSDAASVSNSVDTQFYILKTNICDDPV